MKKKSLESCNINYRCQGCNGGIYGLGVIGAAVYYISNSSGFWVGSLGLLKALVWPAFLVYEILKYISV